MRHRVILVTGGAGFIGSNFVLGSVAAGRTVVNLDKLTYAGNPQNLAALRGNPNHIFIRGDIADGDLLARIFLEHPPEAVVHFAAESHVDRSILGPEEFIQTNLVGSFKLMQAALAYWRSCSREVKENFRFLHVSTDEVYGSLAPGEPAFQENTPYNPNSPYAASKAGSDHLVRAYHHTYGLPTLTTNCSNNYGPYQFPEKLIPLMVLHARDGKRLPVYGDGQNIRDWLCVGDHCDGIMRVLEDGRAGETYNLGGLSERTNLEVVTAICGVMDELHPVGRPHQRLLTYVEDRRGHDRRYAIDCRKIQRELAWAPKQSFTTGLRATVQWYLDHPDWVREVTSGAYRDRVESRRGGSGAMPGVVG